MKRPHRMLRALLGALGRVVPAVAAEVAYQLFWRLGSPAPVSARDRTVHERAARSQLAINGKLVTVYTWGSGPTPVLLVHGWRSRASRFAALVDALETPDRTIIAFDAPGSGDSIGERTTVLEYAAIVRQLADRYGRFEAIIGHSFGTLAGFIAAREGVATDRIVSIAGAYSFDHILATFVDGIGLPARAVPGLRRRIQRRIFPNELDFPRRFHAELDPTETTIPLLVVHDTTDRAVGMDEAELIHDSHTGEKQLMITNGLGHSRILGDPHVIERVSRFIGARSDSSAPSSDDSAMIAAR